MELLSILILSLFFLLGPYIHKYIIENINTDINLLLFFFLAGINIFFCYTFYKILILDNIRNYQIYHQINYPYIAIFFIILTFNLKEIIKRIKALL